MFIVSSEIASFISKLKFRYGTRCIHPLLIVALVSTSLYFDGFELEKSTTDSQQERQAKRLIPLIIFAGTAHASPSNQTAKKAENNSSANDKSGSSKSDPISSKKRYLRKGEFEILGAGCVSCIKKIEMDLRANTGVELVRVSMNVQPPVVTVIYDMDKVKLKQLTDKIEKEGYGIRNQRDSFHSAESTKGKQKGLFSRPELQPF